MRAQSCVDVVRRVFGNAILAIPSPIREITNQFIVAGERFDVWPWCNWSRFPCGCCGRCRLRFLRLHSVQMVDFGKHGVARFLAFRIFRPIACFFANIPMQTWRALLLLQISMQTDQKTFAVAWVGNVSFFAGVIQIKLNKTREREVTLRTNATYFTLQFALLIRLIPLQARSALRWHKRMIIANVIGTAIVEIWIVDAVIA